MNTTQMKSFSQYLTSTKQSSSSGLTAEKKSHPLIFLDYDGVLTSTLETPGSYINHVGDEYGTSPGCLKKLLDLCKKAKAKIVITSNWRKFPPEGFWHSRKNRQVKNNLPELKKVLGKLIYSELPPECHISKSEAMELWVEDHPEFDWKTDKYVIFDDDVREDFQGSKFRHHFILTDPTYGLTDNDCKKAMEMLT